MGQRRFSAEQFCDRRKFFIGKFLVGVAQNV